MSERVYVVGGEEFVIPDSVPADVALRAFKQKFPQAPVPPDLAQAAPSAVQRPEFAQPGGHQALGRSMFQGATMGWGDEAIAGVRTLMNDRPYAANLEEERKRMEGLSQQFPKTSMAGTAAGALGTAGLTAGIGNVPRAAGMARAMFQGAGVGAGYGAIAGAGDATENRARGAAEGAAFGGALGLAAPPITATARGLTQLIGDAAPKAGNFLSKVIPNLTAPKDRPNQIIAEKMLADGLTPNDLLSRARQWMGTGKPVKLADVGGANMTKLSDTALLLPSNGKTQAVEALAERGAGQSGRIAGDISTAVGGAVDRYSASAGFGVAKKAAGPLYDRAFMGAPMVDDPKINSFLTRPAFRAAYQMAKNTLANAGEALPQVFGPDGKLIGVRPSLETLDHIKKGLDDIILNHTWGAAGKSGRTTYISKLKEARNEFVAHLDSLYPEYAAARQTYAGPAAMDTAMREGAEASLSDVREVHKTLMNYRTNSEKNAFRDGVVDSILRNLRNAKDSANGVARVFGSPEQRAILKEVVGGGPAFDALEQSMLAERAMHRTNNTVMGNSATAGRLTGVADLASGGGVNPGIVQGGAVPWALSEGMKRLLNRSRSMNAGGIVKNLLTDDAETAANGLRGYYEAMQKRGRKPRVLPGALGIAGGLLSQ
ncbi:MAG: hypothetical protein ABFE08_09070 [Armatimonadia bacterium]